MVASGRSSAGRKAAAVGWAAVIGLLLTLPLADGAGGLGRALGFGPSVLDHGDKLVHLFLFAVLAALLQTFLPAVPAALLSTAYGGFLEGVQIFIPYRGAELADLAADAAGAVLAVALAAAVKGRRSARAADC
jgi:VanZ like family